MRDTLPIKVPLRMSALRLRMCPSSTVRADSSGKHRSATVISRGTRLPTACDIAQQRVGANS